MDAAGRALTLESLERMLSGDGARGGEEGDRRQDARVMGFSGRVVCDSRQVQAGDVFIAVKGPVVDGHSYVGQALERGAAVVVAQRVVEGVGDGRLIVVEDSAGALGRLAHAAAGWPGERLQVVAVTGTNGKTTVTHLVRSMLAARGAGCGVIGTTGYDVGAGWQEAPTTTPGAVELAGLLARAAANGLPAVAMECSSHALDQKRTSGVRFRAAAFTNLTGDHLDYHGDEATYRAAKARLFAGLEAGAIAVINAEDAAGAAMASAARQAGARVVRYGIGEEWEIGARIVAQGLAGTEFVLRVGGEEVRVRCGLAGRHNVMNCLAAAGLARALGASVGEMAAGIERLDGVPGRLERVGGEDGLAVFVDYAHTDDALANVLRAVRPLARERVIVVFGCGGDRDRTKRPRMGKVAAELADVVVVTDDNPRSEEPGAIRREIVAGMSESQRGKAVEIGDRRGAIEAAIARAREGDVVLIAGKGHETYQIVGSERLAFDDRAVAWECLCKAGGGVAEKTGQTGTRGQDARDTETRTGKSRSGGRYQGVEE